MFRHWMQLDSIFTLNKKNSTEGVSYCVTAPFPFNPDWLWQELHSTLRCTAANNRAVMCS